ncbi:hypothetical protein GCM10007860_27380 [Chitiniphilus shinanonensis]|uniref:Aminoglycoside phosphotransferase domain-containing protein n=1 Tax=Chitiniphilus shinanonensis TaxID=553088 RepID=A0ABQ6BW56_9NEIS|nr:phosphotransferase [Chitiniphilus shinanonensis]GLS05581.1 hypothetical protein GCM10007860_27380 [Chitiniphilus shinanonensis]
MDLSLYRTKSFESIDETQIDGAVKKLSQRYLGLEAGHYEYLGGGSFGLAYKVDCGEKAYVLKFYSQDGMNTTQVKEMQVLRAACRAKVPAVYFCHTRDEAVPLNAVGMEFIEGITCVQLDPNDYPVEARKRMAIEVVDALHDIHCVHGEKFGFIDGPRYDHWLDYYKPFARDLHDWTLANGHDPRHKIPPRMVELFRQSWLLFDRIFDQPITRPTLIHNDFCVCNFMVDPETLALQAIIDPRETMYGDVDLELNQLSNITGNDFFLYETYKERYPVSINCDVKCAFYAIYNEIHCYRLCGQSFEYIYPRMIERLKREIEKYLGIELTL